MTFFVLSYCLPLFLCLLSSLPDKHFPPTNTQVQQVSVIIGADSHIKIHGTTNVNSFSCTYDGNIATDTVHINLQQKPNKVLLENAQLSIAVNRFDCGNAGMNKDFRSLLNYEQHPQMKVDILQLQLAPQDDHQVLAEVKIEIAGETATYQVPVKMIEENGQQYFYGNQPLNIKDFGLTPPKKFLGMVVVHEEVNIDFRLNLSIYQ